MKTPKHVFFCMLAALAVVAGCNDKSLQKYMVEKQGDDNFVKIDLATSLLDGLDSTFSPEEREILHSIKKINVLAYPRSSGDSLSYSYEKTELEQILKQDKYKELTRIKSRDWNATLKYSGEVDAIEEVIVYANDNTKGFALFRVLGNDMRPEQIIKLIQAADRSDIDLSKLPGFQKNFKD